MDRLSRAALGLKWAGDDRTIAQLRADVFTQVMLQTNDGVIEHPQPPVDDSDAIVTWFRGITPTVMVTVPVLSLCGRLAKYCDIDHTRQWFADTGPTNHNNLAHLCRGHHTLKGETAWSVIQDPEGSGALIWISPTGHIHVTEPAVLLPH